MKKTFIFLLLALSAALSAQVSLEMQLNSSIYLQHEPVFVKIKMRNFSGQALIFGGSEKLHGELLFEIVGPDRRIMQMKNQNKIPLLGTILRPGETKEFVLPLSTHFDLSQIGTYRGHAYVKHQMLRDMFKSNNCKFEINRGVEKWRMPVGMPDVLSRAQKQQDKIIERDYVIKMLITPSNKYFYLMIEDKKNLYTVMRIGREIGMKPYKVDVDMLSRLHILMPISPRVYRYNVITPQGQVEISKFLKNTETIPSLVRDPGNGRVYVVGGGEALPGVDYELKQDNNTNATTGTMGKR